MQELLFINLFSMRKYILFLIFWVVPLVLVWCGKDSDWTKVITSTWSSEGPQYTLEELEAMFKKPSQQVFSITWSSTVELSTYLQWGKKDIAGLINLLTWSDTSSIEKRAYLKSYLWDYEWAIKEKEKLCKSDVSKCPKPLITIDLWNSQDQSGTLIWEINLSIDGQEINHESSIVQPEVYENMVHRVHAEKEWYLDAYDKINSIEGGYNELAFNPIMAKADARVEFDNQIGGTFSTGDWTWSIRYTFAPNTFADTRWVVKGTVTVYLFALTPEDNNLSAFSLDSFSMSWVSLWNGMITNGMPFVTAYKNGEKIHNILPIEWVGVMSLWVTPMDMKNVPKNTWLSNSELENYGLPGYWKLNRETGVWIESKMQLLDESGTYKFQL